jgi:hypothetical protein
MTDALSVIGSRRFPDFEQVVPYGIDQYRGDCDTLISGGASGVDTTAEAYGRELGLTVISYRPERWNGLRYAVKKYVDGEAVEVVSENGFALTWPTFPEAAKQRNWWIVRDGFQVLAFWDGFSSGTSHGIAASARYGRKLRIWMEGDS